MCETENLLKVLETIAEKMSMIVPVLQNIEIRLATVENEKNSEISYIRNTLDIIKGCVLDNPALSINSDQVSQSDSEQDLGMKKEYVEAAHQHDQHVHDHHHGPDECVSGIVLSDSDLTFKQSDQLSEHLKCNIRSVNYNSDSENIKQSLLDPNLEFILIQDSGETVSQQNELSHDSMNEIQTLARYQLELARMVVRLRPGIEVFIGCLPPRFDTLAHTELAELYNNTMVAESFLDDHVTIVSQNSMYTNIKEKLEERFTEDGVNLTKYGTHLMMKNIARQISDTVPGMRCVKQSKGSKYRKVSRNKVRRLLNAIFI